uniref:hypothetical protein n=1 Tax=Ochrobactrum sp. LM19 TaxID=1449781 RepID=UPI0015E80231|nr:hypothetical protein [Ochrobactrum sp. LM19]
MAAFEHRIIQLLESWKPISLLVDEKFATEPTESPPGHESATGWALDCIGVGLGCNTVNIAYND